jgi:hypothetical protein
MNETLLDHAPGDCQKKVDTVHGDEPIERGIELLIEAMWAHELGQGYDAIEQEFQTLAHVVGPVLFATRVRDVAGDRLASALARDYGGDLEELRAEARAAFARDIHRRFRAALVTQCAGAA